ncbi:hypothetical protein J2S09_001275 [Bacillus fengqiuensis]|nr:hypothetical protein [Bacillus fengqiuensis]
MSASRLAVFYFTSNATALTGDLSSPFNRSGRAMMSGLAKSILSKLQKFSPMIPLTLVMASWTGKADTSGGSTLRASMKKVVTP